MEKIKLSSILKGDIATQLGRIFIILIVCVVAFSFITGSKSDGTSALEKRIAHVLSQVEGAGKVDVAIYSKRQSVPTTSSVASFGVNTQEESVPCGAVVVAEGAGSVRVQIALSNAIQTLLGIPPSSVEVLKRIEER